MQEKVLKEFSEKKEISSKGYALFSKDGSSNPMSSNAMQWEKKMF